MPFCPLRIWMIHRTLIGMATRYSEPASLWPMAAPAGAASWLNAGGAVGGTTPGTSIGFAACSNGLGGTSLPSRYDRFTIPGYIHIPWAVKTQPASSFRLISAAFRAVVRASRRRFCRTRRFRNSTAYTASSEMSGSAASHPSRSGSAASHPSRSPASSSQPAAALRCRRECRGIGRSRSKP